MGRSQRIHARRWLLAAKKAALEQLRYGATAGQVARALGCSESYFLTRLRRLEGVTFGSWLRGVRVRRAQRLLLHGATVEEAAEKVGYADARGLQRAFQRETGQPPGRWRADALLLEG